MRILRITLFGFGGLLALPLFWVVAGFIGAVIPGPATSFDGPKPRQIGLIATAIHYDLLLPLDAETRAEFAFADQAGVFVNDPAAGFLLVGWGARDFYQSAGSYGDVPLRAVANGIIGDASVIRLEVWADQPLAEIPSITLLSLTEQGHAALIRHIRSEFGQTPQTVATPGLTPHDAFFAARSRFSILNTCNVWIAGALRAAGVPLGIWTPTPQALRLSLALFA